MADNIGEEKELSAIATDEENDLYDGEDGLNRSDADEEDSGAERGGVSEKKASGPHFDAIESVLYVSVAIISDVLDGIWITRFFFGPAILLWLWLKEVKVVGKNAVAQGIELIPIIGWLPMSTVAAVLTIMATNNPAVFEKYLGEAGKMAKKALTAGKK